MAGNWIKACDYCLGEMLLFVIRLVAWQKPARRKNNAVAMCFIGIGLYSDRLLFSGDDSVNPELQINSRVPIITFVYVTNACDFVTFQKKQSLFCLAPLNWGQHFD